MVGYVIHEEVAHGAYGRVYSATDMLTQELVAIKRISNTFAHVEDARRILREIKLLRLMDHDNIVSAKTVCMPANPSGFQDVFIVMESMEANLTQVIKDNPDLTADHHRVFIFQILRGLAYLHKTMGVMHRDLKPSNILVNSNCKIKLCDFGLSRPLVDGDTAVAWTDYVATRWYRAPELVGMFYGRYTCAVDMWSVGCIFAEILLRKPIFPGRCAMSQLQLITDLLGKPSAHAMKSITNSKARAVLEMMPDKAPSFDTAFGGVPPPARDLLRGLLAIDPGERLTVEQALGHPYFDDFPRVPVPPHPLVDPGAFKFDHRPELSMKEVRQLMVGEINQHHKMPLGAITSAHQPLGFIMREGAMLKLGYPVVYPPLYYGEPKTSMQTQLYMPVPPVDPPADQQTIGRSQSCSSICNFNNNNNYNYSCNYNCNYNALGGMHQKPGEAVV
jgi:serine/threonine protein kinase